jgi:hypothetical protein
MGTRPGNLHDEFDPLAQAERGEAVRIKTGLTEILKVSAPSNPDTHHFGRAF